MKIIPLRDVEYFTKMKRKADTDLESESNREDTLKRRAIDRESSDKRFRDGLFDKSILDGYQKAYTDSEPYVLNI